MAAIFIIIMPLFNEGIDCFRAIRFRENGIQDVAIMERDSPANKSGDSIAPNKTGGPIAPNGKHTQSFTQDDKTAQSQGGNQLIQEVAPLSNAPDALVQSEAAIPDAVSDDNGSISSNNPRAPIFD